MYRLQCFVDKTSEYITITLAGLVVVVDIEIQAQTQEPSKISISYAADIGNDDHTNEILLRNLVEGDWTRFCDNMRSLSQWDKLGSENFNLFKLMNNINSDLVYIKELESQNLGESSNMANRLLFGHGELVDTSLSLAPRILYWCEKPYLEKLKGMICIFRLFCFELIHKETGSLDDAPAYAAEIRAESSEEVNHFILSSCFDEQSVNRYAETYQKK